MIKSLKLADYKEPNYLIPNVYLEVDIQDSFTEVTGRFQLENNPNTSESEIFLHGINLELISIQLDDAVLPADSFKKTDQGISLKLTKPTHQLEIKVRNKPHENKELEGLYKSSDLFVTQMEAEGFRRFCYFMDRPDVLSIYEVKLLASKERFPTLLANGDKSEEGALEGGRHYSIWKDPSPKPCYLFAIVAGKLSSIKDKFVTSSGKDVALEIYSENQYKERLAYSMEYLKQSMKWDQDRYNLEYDLNTYMIVAADNFNAGAMENKGLNIFNTRLLLADQNTATENNLYTIQSVVGHEYFHNWSGNRVTCKNWFQLSLKEGLTVYRDQEFTSDLNSRTVKRIEDVVTLRTAQFPEDLGPNSHPIRPEEVINMANFYTPTVYEKGSEVIRMIHTLIGEHEFQKGLKDYFSRFDGQAVTCDDFVDCMERNSSFDFSEFRKWYSTRGTPLVKIEISYSNEEQKYSLELTQKNLKDESAPYLPIPLKIAFFHKISGQRIEMKHNSVSKNSEGDDCLLLTGQRLKIELENTEDLYLSINRDFSAPVIIETNQSAEELEFLAQFDDNFFNRYESIQKLYLEELNKRLTGDTFISDLPNLVEQILAIADRDEALCNLALSLPSLEYFTASHHSFNLKAVKEAYDGLEYDIVASNSNIFEKLFLKLQEETKNKFGLEFKGKKELKYKLLQILVKFDHVKYAELIKNTIQQADNYSDATLPLYAMSDVNLDFKDQFLADYRQRWINDPLLLTQYFRLIAGDNQNNVLEKIMEAEKSSEFDETNPNHIFSLFGGFMMNHRYFHDDYKSNYEFVVNKVLEIDKYNSQTAGRLLARITLYDKFGDERITEMKKHLKNLLNQKPSNNVYEVAKNMMNA